MEEPNKHRETEFVAPWNRPNIPDYGPLQNKHHAVIFFFVGLTATIVYEWTDYFSDVARWMAYLAIWGPLYYRLQSQVTLDESTEDVVRKEEVRERRRFDRKLDQIMEEASEEDEMPSLRNTKE